MASRNSNYTNASIQTIDEERDQVRQKPHNYFGTVDAAGCAHGTFELVTNSTDEIREGFGDTIEICIYDDFSVSVKDNGRGVPMGWNYMKEQYNYHLVYGKLYASGKYDSINYGSAAGLNGVGAAITQFASDYMKVVSVRDEEVEWEKDKQGNYITDENGYRKATKIARKKFTMNFKDGYEVGKLEVEDTDEETGTYVEYLPAREVFKTIDIPIELYVDRLRRVAMLVPQAHIIFDYKGRKLNLHYENGMSSYIEAICKDYITKNIIQIEADGEGSDDEADQFNTYHAAVDIRFTFSRSVSLIEGYHNATYLSEGGVAIDAMKSGITKVIEGYARESGKIKKNEKIQQKDVEEILVAICATECPGSLTQFKHQTKTAIGNDYIRRLTLLSVTEQFKQWAVQNKEEMDKIIAEVLLNKTARETASEIKKQVIRKMKQDIHSTSGKLKKLKDCNPNTPVEKKEIYIVEGDSAGSACVTARNGETQAILPLRGKIMNCAKKRLEQILKSDIIVEFIRAIGCGIELKSKYIQDLPEFNIKNLNYGKILICTDADVDGYHIRILVLCMIFRLMPTLIKEGRVFIVESPLYTIEVAGEHGQTVFAFTEQEREEKVRELVESGISRNKIHIDRSKGLGENDADMMAISTMRPETRRLTQVKYPEDDRKLIETMNALLGEEVADRRAMIERYFDEKYLVS